MTKCQICNCQIQNCTCPGFAHLCKTCRERNTLDEQGNCTCCPNCRGSKTNDSCSCCSICSGSPETCNCCKVCGKPMDFCQGCCNTCKQVQCEYVCPQYQQPQCSCCMTCHASNPSPAVYVVQSATSHTVYAARTAENRNVELVVQGVYRRRPPVTVAKGVKRQKLTATVLPRSKYWQRPLSLRHPPLCPA